MSVLEMDRSRLAWWAVGLALAAALSFVVYSFVGTFVFGLFIYYATRPIYRRIKRRVRPPSLAALIALFLLALPVLALVAYTGAIAVSEALRLTNQGFFDVDRLPISEAQLAQLTDFERLLTLDPEMLTAERLQQVLSSLSSAGDVAAFVGVGLVHLFAMIALAFYLLRDDRKLSRWARTQVADDRGVMETFLGSVDRDFTNIFFGNILNAVLTGTIGVIAYSLLNLVSPPGVAIPAAALVGLFAGVASLIPVVGMKLVYAPVAAYMAVTSYLFDPTTLWFTFAFVAVSFVVVDTIPDLVLRPYVSGRNLHVGAVMIAYTLGPLLFGWYGIFLGPILLVLVVNFAKHVLPVLVNREPLVPYSVDPGVAETADPGPEGASDVAADGRGTSPSAADERQASPRADDGGFRFDSAVDGSSSRAESDGDERAKASRRASESANRGESESGGESADNGDETEIGVGNAERGETERAGDATSGENSGDGGSGSSKNG